MICRKCRQEAPDGPFCALCGTRQDQGQSEKKSVKRRGNGQGSVYKLQNGRYKAVTILYYYADDDGKLKKKTRSATFKTKKEAVAALPTMKKEERQQLRQTTLANLYELWLPQHKAGKSTIDGYKYAFRYFSSVYNMKIEDIEIEDLQDCLDACGKGRRTQENMKAAVGLVYKFGIPRRYIPDNLNLSQFLRVGGSESSAKQAFTADQIQLIKNGIGVVLYADYVYCMIYLGFRPSEFLSLSIENYDRKNGSVRGGAKTEAGTNRLVTISPKIQYYMEAIVGDRQTGVIFPNKQTGEQFNLKYFTEKVFYAVLFSVGIDNPVVEVDGVKRHKYTPHSCRHTFATLMKRVDGADKDKLELIGHTSDEMLRYYQDVDLNDLRKITDKI